MNRQRHIRSVGVWFLVFAIILSTFPGDYMVYAEDAERLGAISVQQEETKETEETLEDTSEEEKLAETDPAEETDDNTAEDQVEPEESATEEIETETGEETVETMSQVAAEGDELVLKAANSSGVFEDVDTIGNNVSWPLTSPQKQIQIYAKFSEQGSEKDRTIEVKIPQGYKILEYTIKKGDPSAIDDNIGQLVLADEDDAKLASAELTALDGSSWAAQRISGYTASRSTAEVDVRTYAGRVFYTFNPNCDQITLTLTLGVQKEFLPYNATEVSLDEVMVEMNSGSNRLGTGFSATVSELVVPYVLTDTTPAEGDINTGKGSFTTRVGVFSYNYGIGSMNHYAEKQEYKIHYPMGAELKSFTDMGILGTSVTGDGNGGTYGNGHLTVVNDTVNQVVTFSYSNVFVTHVNQAGITLNWEMDINESGLVSVPWDGTAVNLRFSINMNETSGGGSGLLAEHLEKSAETVVSFRKSGWDITIEGQNRVRHDLNAAGTYPYDYALGSFHIRNVGPSKAANLTYKWEFDNTLRVRAVSFPSGAGDTLSDVQAVVYDSNGPRRIVSLAKTYTTEIRTIVQIKAEDLGLAEDEYIKELTANQSSLESYSYTPSYTNYWGNYYGRFQNGQSGSAVLTITDDQGFAVTATDTTTIGWSNSAAGTVSMNAVKSVPDGADSWYPGDKINVTSRYTSGSVLGGKTQNDIVDPTIIISLPEGIELDTSSVKAVSPAGNNGGVSASLELKSMDDITYNGIDWTVYRYSSRNSGDMIANAANMGGSGVKGTYIDVRFTMNVSTACRTYGELPASDMIGWDLGQTAVNSTAGTDYTRNDLADRAGKGADYKLAVPTTGSNYFVVLKPGLNVALGVKTADSDTDYYTYNGADATIAPLAAGGAAEIKLEYTNISNTEYREGTEIYIPIPKAGLGYNNYFNYLTNDSIVTRGLQVAEFDVSLISAISLPGFDTYYTKDTSGSTNEGPPDNSWVPVNSVWIPQADMTAADYAEITMVKFVANESILPNAGNSNVFRVRVNSVAGIGHQNFWRSYQKGWVDSSGTGSWIAGSYVAAETAKAGILGRIFNDKNANGVMDTGEEYANTGGEVSAILEGTTISPIKLSMQADGTFATPKGYYLKVGDYTVTIANGDETMGFTAVTSPDQSDNGEWRMDILQDKIAGNQRSAVFEFTVMGEGNLEEEYIGVGLNEIAEVVYKAGAGVSFGDVTEYVNYQANPLSAPSLGSDDVAAGYDITTQMWTLDKTVELKDGATIVAGTKITRAQLYQVIVTEDLEATVNLDPISYSISYDTDGGTADNPDNYDVTNDITLINPTRVGYDFAGWIGTGLSDPQLTVVIPAGSIGDRSYTATWTATRYMITYDLDEGTIVGSNPAEYTIESGEITLLNPTKAGCTFTGWTGTGLSSPQEVVTIAAGSIGDRSYTANWTIDNYIITTSVSSGMGTIMAAPDSVTLGGDSVVMATASTGYRITYMKVNNITVTPETVDNISTYTLTNITEHMDVTVAFVPIAYTVNFFPNGGSGSSQTQRMTYDEEVALRTFSGNEFDAPAGYHFIGWNTDPHGTTAEYADGQLVKNLAESEDASLTLYAIYGEDSNVDIYYKSTDTTKGTVSSAGESIAPVTEMAAGAKAEPKPGYMFLYWTNDNSGDVISYDRFFVPARVDGLNIAGSYSAHFVKADAMGLNGQIGGNHFSYGVRLISGGISSGIDEVKAKELAQISVSGYLGGTGIPQDVARAVVDAEELNNINSAIAAGRYGVFDLTFYTEDYRLEGGEISVGESGDKVTVKVTLTAIGSSGDRIGGSDFIYGVMKSEADQSATPGLTAAQVLALAEAWARDGEMSHYDQSVLSVNTADLKRINDAKARWFAEGSDYSGAKEFPLMITSPDGDTVTIKVTLYSYLKSAADGNVLAANHFRHNVINGTLNIEAVKSKAALTWRDSYGNQLDGSRIVLREAELGILNDAITVHRLGTYHLTFEAPDGFTHTITVTLIGTVITADNAEYDVRDGQLSEQTLKELLGVLAFDASGNTISYADITIGADQMSQVNQSIAGGNTDIYTITLMAPDGTEISADLILYRYDIEGNDIEMTLSELNDLGGSDLEQYVVEKSATRAWKTVGNEVEELGITANITSLKGIKTPELGEQNETEKTLVRKSKELSGSMNPVKKIDVQAVDGSSQQKSDSEVKISSPQGVSKKKRSVKTGDASSTLIWSTLASAALVLSILLNRKKIRDPKDT